MNVSGATDIIQFPFCGTHQLSNREVISETSVCLLTTDLKNGNKSTGKIIARAP